MARLLNQHLTTDQSSFISWPSDPGRCSWIDEAVPLFFFIFQVAHFLAELCLNGAAV